MLEKTLYNYAIRLLARGEQTAFQLTTKLTQKYKSLTLKSVLSGELSQDNNIDIIISHIIIKIMEAGWLSEKRFAHAFARTKITQKIGPVKILYELSQKGLTETQIQTYLEDCEAWQEADWVALAHQVLTKKFTDNKPVIWPKKANFLQSKGYTVEQIKQALKKNAHANPNVNCNQGYIIDES